MRDKDAQLMMETLKEAQWGSTDAGQAGGSTQQPVVTTGYVLDLTTQKLTTLTSTAVANLTKNLQPVDSEDGVTYAYDNFIVIIPNQQPDDRLATAT
tara:strand:+ start:634 stop:924 length:291 start_codon:yes stop_codon:yes gene_type:complete